MAAAIFSSAFFVAIFSVNAIQHLIAPISFTVEEAVHLKGKYVVDICERPEWAKYLNGLVIGHHIENNGFVRLDVKRDRGGVVGYPKSYFQKCMAVTEP